METESPPERKRERERETESERGSRVDIDESIEIFIRDGCLGRAVTPINSRLLISRTIEDAARPTAHKRATSRIIAARS